MLACVTSPTTLPILSCTPHLLLITPCSIATSSTTVIQKALKSFTLNCTTSPSYLSTKWCKCGSFTSIHLGCKTLPSAGLQLNTIHPRQAWLSPGLHQDIYTEIVIHDGVKRAHGGRIGGKHKKEVQGCSPTGPTWWDAPESKQHMVPPWATTHTLHVQQQSRLLATHAHTHAQQTHKTSTRLFISFGHPPLFVPIC